MFLEVVLSVKSLRTTAVEGYRLKNLLFFSFSVFTVNTKQRCVHFCEQGTICYINTINSFLKK